MPKRQHRPSYHVVQQMLREMREKADLSQRGLAARLHRRPSYVQKSEQGGRRIDIAEFIEWAVACGVEPEGALRELLRSFPWRGSARVPKRAI